MLRSLPQWISKLKNLRLNSRQLILILSAVVGLLVGFAAVIIKNIVHFIQVFAADLA